MLRYKDAGREGQFTRIEERSWAKGYGKAFIFDAEIEHLIDQGELEGTYCVKFIDKEGYNMVTSVPVDEFIFK